MIAAVFAIGGCSKDETTNNSAELPPIDCKHICGMGNAMSNENDVDQMAISARVDGNVTQRLSGGSLPYFSTGCATVTDDPAAGRTVIDRRESIEGVSGRHLSRHAPAFATARRPDELVVRLQETQPVERTPGGVRFVARDVEVSERIDAEPDPHAHLITTCSGSRELNRVIVS